MNIRNIDLNLLVILDALIAERSVSRAAHRLGLTQSAVSHALRRLRGLFGDELLMRSAGGMDLTARAVQLAEELARGARANSVNGQSARRLRSRNIEPASSACACPTMCRVFCSAGYAVSCASKHPARGSMSATSARTAKISSATRFTCALARIFRSLAKYSRLRVFDDEFVVVMSKRHLLARKGEMTLERYVSLIHLKVAASAIGTNLIDDALARRGLKRDIADARPELA